DILDLHSVDVDAPLERGAVDHDLESFVEPLSIGQQVIELALADHGAQRRLCDLGHGVSVVLDVHDGPNGVGDVEVNNRIDLYRYVVFGDAVLRGNGHRDDLHVDLAETVDAWRDQVQARAADRWHNASEPEDEPSLVLLDDACTRGHPRDRYSERAEQDTDEHHYLRPIPTA